MAKKIGLIVGREWSFPPAFIEEVNGRGVGVVARYVKLGTPEAAGRVDYDVIVDRFSHEVPFYRSFLKHAALQGVRVINDPFALDAEDRFSGAALAHALGVATPVTIVLPHHDYGPEIVHEESLRNLDYPLDWQAVLDRVGVPCVLRTARPYGVEEAHLCHSVEELLRHYNGSGTRLMVVQERIQWEHFVRCLTFGGDDALPLKYDPLERKYQVHHEHLSTELGERIVDESLRLSRALGYELNAIDWAIREGVPHAVDLLNPVPDLDVYALSGHYFERVVEKVADVAIALALAPGGGALPDRESRGAPATARPASNEAIATNAEAPRDDGAGDLAEELPSLAQGLPRTKL